MFTIHSVKINPKVPKFIPPTKCTQQQRKVHQKSAQTHKEVPKAKDHPKVSEKFTKSRKHKTYSKDIFCSSLTDILH